MNTPHETTPATTLPKSTTEWPGFSNLVALLRARNLKASTHKGVAAVSTVGKSVRLYKSGWLVLQWWQWDDRTAPAARHFTKFLMAGKDFQRLSNRSAGRHKGR